MLVLTRRKNQSLFIGNNVEVKILSISNNSVRIGIDAPNTINILRSEVMPNPALQNEHAKTMA